MRQQCEFLSTPPVWVATLLGDAHLSTQRSFYPRHPCGWRLGAYDPTAWGVEFLSTPPVWVATAPADMFATMEKFLSTPPVWVATICFDVFCSLPALFLSTPPVWVATGVVDVRACKGGVSIHATRVGGDEVPHD